MQPKQRRYPPLGMIAVGLAMVASLIVGWNRQSQAQELDPAGQFLITGEIKDTQDQPVVEAEITAHIPGDEEVLAQAESQEDGRWSLSLNEIPPQGIMLIIERAHFIGAEINLDPTNLSNLQISGAIAAPIVVLERHINAGFWAATIIFIAVLLVIAFEKLHSTTAALAAMSAVMLVSDIGGAINQEWFIFSFERAISYINWEVIFLVMGMMIVIAVIEAQAFSSGWLFKPIITAVGETGCWF